VSDDDQKRRDEAMKRTAVLQLPGMDAVEVERELRYGDGGTFDLYSPPGRKPGTSTPAVVFVFGFPDPLFAQGLRHMGAYSSWGRLLAASGMSAIAYSYRDPVTDTVALLRHLRASAPALGLDPERLGLWAASGNVPTALHLLMTEPPDAFRCAALLYGYMLDVPEAAMQFGIAAPSAGRSIDGLPAELPLLVVRAGGDETPLLNPSIDHFVAAAIARDLPLTFVNQSRAPHAFDLFDDSEASRDAIRGVLGFLRHHLGA